MGEAAASATTGAEGGADLAQTAGDAATGAESASAALSGTSAADAEVDAAARARFYCFGWVHGPEFSTDCYRTSAECERERLEMKQGSRDVMPGCSVTEGAWCTRVARKPNTSTRERCFGGAENCRRYESFVQGNGHTTTGCTAK